MEEKKKHELDPEQAAAILENLKPTIERIGQAIQQIGKQLAQTFKKLSDKYIDNMLYCANDNPRWWHLYKHSKKWRVRKKYRRKLMQQLHRKLKEEAARR